MLTPYVLALLACCLAWPVPLWLQHAKWPSKAPGAALVLWQAIGISGGLALVTAPLTWGLHPFGSGLCSALLELFHVAQTHGITGVVHDERWHPLGLAAITLALLLFGHLALMLLHTAFRTVRQRKKHREFVEILSASLQDHDHNLPPEFTTHTQTRVLPVEHPLAYCLPDINRPLTVVSRGLIDELTSQQLAAVLAHEAAHLTQRHDVLRLAFQAWHKAVPWFPATGVAVNEVTELTEIMADDAALRHHDRTDLLAALAYTADSPASSDTATRTTATDEQSALTSRRLARLLQPAVALSSGRITLVIILAILLVTVPAVISLL